MKNNTSCFPSIDEPPDLTSLRHLAYGIIFPVILAIGFFFNTFSLLAACRSALNSIALSYLMAMITSNLSLMILAIPWLISRSTNPDQCRTHSDVIYHVYIEPVLLNWMTTFSTYVLMCMSVERYVSVSHPGFFRRIHRLPRARAALYICLLTSLIIHVPMFLKQTWTCAECWTIRLNIEVVESWYWLVYIWTSQIVARFLPCVILIVLNTITVVKYRQLIFKRSAMTTDAISQCNTPNSSLNNLSTVIKTKKPTISSSSQDEKRQMKLLSGLVCLVAVCIVPTGVAVLLPPSSQHFILWIVVEGLELFHHSVVSFVICLFNNDIQRRLKKMITCNSASI